MSITHNERLIDSSVSTDMAELVNGHNDLPDTTSRLVETYEQTCEKLGVDAEKVILKSETILNYFVTLPEKSYEVRRTMGLKKGGKNGWLAPQRIIKNDIGINSPEDEKIADRALAELERRGILEAYIDRDRTKGKRTNSLRLNPASLDLLDISYISEEMRKKISSDLASDTYIPPVVSGQEAKRGKEYVPKSGHYVPRRRAPVPLDEIDIALGHIKAKNRVTPTIDEVGVGQPPERRSQLVAFETGDMGSLLKNSVAIAKAILVRGERTITEPDSDILLHTIAQLVCEPNIRLVEDTLRGAQDKNWIAMHIMAESPAKIIVKKGFAKAIEKLIKNEIAHKK